MRDMIECLLNEAELPGELSKLSVYGRSLEGLKELLTHLLSHPDTGWQLRRQARNVVMKSPHFTCGEATQDNGSYYTSSTASHLEPHRLYMVMTLHSSSSALPQGQQKGIIR